MFDVTFTTKTSVLSAYTTHQVLFLSDLSWSWLISWHVAVLWPARGSDLTNRSSWHHCTLYVSWMNIYQIHWSDLGHNNFAFWVWFIGLFLNIQLLEYNYVTWSMETSRHKKKKQNFKVIKQLHSELWRSLLHKSLKAKKSETAGCHHSVSWSNLQ